MQAIYFTDRTTFQYNRLTGASAELTMLYDSNGKCNLKGRRIKSRVKIAMRLYDTEYD